MSKAILMSVNPQIVVKILNREQDSITRNGFPKDYKGWVYICCTKGKPIVTAYDNYDNGNWQTIYDTYHEEIDYDALNGKVVCRFYCDKVKKITIFTAFTMLEIPISQLEIFDKPKELTTFYAEKLDCSKCKDSNCKYREGEKFPVGHEKRYYNYNCYSVVMNPPKNYRYIEVKNE